MDIRRSVQFHSGVYCSHSDLYWLSRVIYSLHSGVSSMRCIAPAVYNVSRDSVLMASTTVGTSRIGAERSYT